MRAVVFDFDGVLVDSEGLHFQALRGSLAPVGIPLDLEEYTRTYLAYDDHEAVRVALERHGRPAGPADVAPVARRKAEIFAELLPSVPFFPGARELVRAVAARVPVAIASGALRGEIERILEGGGLRDAFGAIVGADDCRRTKPHPEPYLAAVAALASHAPGLQPRDCVAVEDSAAGIRSARDAGLRVIGVTTSYPAGKLGDAHHVVGSVADLTPELMAEVAA